MRIFVTVGNALQPFDRMVDLVDGAIEQSGVTAEGLFQAGHCTRGSKYLPTEIHVSRSDFRREIERADVFVAHGGIGTLFDGIQAGQIPLVFPRRAAFGEHVNDHQLEITDALAAAGKVIRLKDMNELADILKDVGDGRSLRRPTPTEGERQSALKPFRRHFDKPSGRKPRWAGMVVLRALAALGPSLGRLRIR